MSKPLRSVSLAAALTSALFNSIVAVRLLASWRVLGWESESEWEASSDVWRVDSLKLIWGLVSAYFASAALASLAGAVGLAKTVPSFVRFYRDYSIADLAFVSASTLLLGYAAFTRPLLRATVCEELSRHGDFMRDMVEMGLNLENCELWFERAIVAVIGVMFILIVIRLHIVVALSKYYCYLARDAFSAGKSHTGLRPLSTDALRRIYLLPSPTSPGSGPGSAVRTLSADDVCVYAPVPLGGLSEQDARKMHATEAWISTRAVEEGRTEMGAMGGKGAMGSPRAHRHSRSYSSHAHSHSHRHHGARPGSRPAPSRRESGCEKDASSLLL
ncbi:hypothetical protein AcW1_004383 [Taiwanofungus camphoratus]|nr:hypothetical protein AcW1_004383 [Antrodia cinnamomea]